MQIAIGEYGIREAEVPPLAIHLGAMARSFPGVRSDNASSLIPQLADESLTRGGNFLSDKTI
jgi:hypothetical protein